MPVEGCCQAVEISLPRPVWAALDLPMEASYALTEVVWGTFETRFEFIEV